MAVTWSEMASLLGITRKYLFMLRVGTRQAGPALERRIRDLEHKNREQKGNTYKEDGYNMSTCREALADYDTTNRDQLLLNLAAENAGLKARLAELDERLKHIEGKVR